ncbi:unnamed protein product [Closterium sp. Naga37s-1]|nr:unnamed protein product [Closterium sp. Naga37s-1]
MPHALFPMPSPPCPLPHALSPMPSPPCPLPHALSPCPLPMPSPPCPLPHALSPMPSPPCPLPHALSPMPSPPCPLPHALSPMPSPPCPLPHALSPMPSPPCPLPHALSPMPSPHALSPMPSPPCPLPLALSPLPSPPCPLPLALSPMPSPPCPLPLALSPMPSPPCPLPLALSPMPSPPCRLPHAPSPMPSPPCPLPHALCPLPSPPCPPPHALSPMPSPRGGTFAHLRSCAASQRKTHERLAVVASFARTDRDVTFAEARSLIRGGMRSCAASQRKNHERLAVVASFARTDLPLVPQAPTALLTACVASVPNVAVSSLPRPPMRACLLQQCGARHEELAEATILTGMPSPLQQQRGAQDAERGGKGGRGAAGRGARRRQWWCVRSAFMQAVMVVVEGTQAEGQVEEEGEEGKEENRVEDQEGTTEGKGEEGESDVDCFRSLGEAGGKNGWSLTCYASKASGSTACRACSGVAWHQHSLSWEGTQGCVRGVCIVRVWCVWQGAHLQEAHMACAERTAALPLTPKAARGDWHTECLKGLGGLVYWLQWQWPCCLHPCWRHAREGSMEVSIPLPHALSPLLSPPCSLPRALCPVPSAPCPLPLALCPLPSAPCPLPHAPLHLCPPLLRAAPRHVRSWRHALVCGIATQES